MRLSVAGALPVAALLLLAGCVTSPPQQQRHPQRPRIETTRDLALLSSLGDESGVKVTSIDGVPFDGGNGGRMGRHPRDPPVGMNSSMGVWLSPGFHLLQVQDVRNVEGGISFTRGDIPVRVSAGHTYIVQPVLAPDFGKVSFSVIDHGASFPIGCLPWSIGMTKPPDASGKRARFTRADILACRERTPRSY